MVVVELDFHFKLLLKLNPDKIREALPNLRPEQSLSPAGLNIEGRCICRCVLYYIDKYM